MTILNQNADNKGNTSYIQARLQELYGVNKNFGSKPKGRQNNRRKTTKTLTN